MAKINKWQYAYREESAARRNAENAEIAISNGMPEDIAEMVTELCSLRHHLHCNINQYVHGYEGDNIQRLADISYRLEYHGLPCFDSPLDIKTFDVCMEEFTIDDPDGLCSEIANEFYRVHQSIEDCLNEIDQLTKTKFCPTGALRIF